MCAGANAVRSSVPASQAQRAPAACAPTLHCPTCARPCQGPAGGCLAWIPMNRARQAWLPHPAVAACHVVPKQARGLNVTVSFLPPRSARHFARRASPTHVASKRSDVERLYKRSITIDPVPTAAAAACLPLLLPPPPLSQPSKAHPASLPAAPRLPPGCCQPG